MRPKVIVHNLASVDGRVSLAPNTLLLTGDPRWEAVAGSTESVYRQLKQTYQPQALLEGSGSFVTDDFQPAHLPPVEGNTEALYEDYLPKSLVEKLGRWWMVVTDSRGRVRWGYKEFPGDDWQGCHLLVLVSQHTPPSYLAYLQREYIPYLVAGKEPHVDLKLALEKLSKLGITTLVSTAGSRLQGALLRAGLIDEVSLQFFPALISGSQTPTLFDSPELLPNQMPTRLRLLGSEVLEGGKIWLRYAVVGEEKIACWAHHDGSSRP